jgi:hypothetical protein
VPESQGAGLGVRCQIGLQPLVLRRSLLEVDHIVDVEHDDVPVPQVQAVVAQPTGAHPVAEVIEGGGGVCRAVLMIAERGPGPRLVPAPTRAVAVAVGVSRAVGKDVVTQGEDRSLERVEDRRGALVVSGPAGGNVASHQDDLGWQGLGLNWRVSATRDAHHRQKAQ